MVAERDDLIPRTLLSAQTMAMTSDQMQEALTMLIQQVAKLAGATKNGATSDEFGDAKEARDRGSPKLDLKNFMRVEKFSGGDAAWKDWSIDFKVVIVSVHPSMQKWFHICETT